MHSLTEQNINEFSSDLIKIIPVASKQHSFIGHYTTNSINKIVSEYLNECRSCENNKILSPRCSGSLSNGAGSTVSDAFYKRELTSKLSVLVVAKALLSNETTSIENNHGKLESISSYSYYSHTQTPNGNSNNAQLIPVMQRLKQIFNIRIVAGGFINFSFRKRFLHFQPDINHDLSSYNYAKIDLCKFQLPDHHIVDCLHIYGMQHSNKESSQIVDAHISYAVLSKYFPYIDIVKHGLIDPECNNQTCVDVTKHCSSSHADDKCADNDDCDKHELIDSSALLHIWSNDFNITSKILKHNSRMSALKQKVSETDQLSIHSNKSEETQRKFNASVHTNGNTYNTADASISATIFDDKSIDSSSSQSHSFSRPLQTSQTSHSSSTSNLKAPTSSAQYSMNVTSIGVFHSCFSEKFGTPRQGAVTPLSR
jgi:hypothetical protein